MKNIRGTRQVASAAAARVPFQFEWLSCLNDNFDLSLRRTKEDDHGHQSF